jgi:hypothetical protein
LQLLRTLVDQPPANRRIDATLHFPRNPECCERYAYFFLEECLSLPCWLSQFRKIKLRQPTGQRLTNVRTQQKRISIGPILFLYYEESLVSSNLNSKLYWFHSPSQSVPLILIMKSEVSWDPDNLQGPSFSI